MSTPQPMKRETQIYDAIIRIQPQKLPSDLKKQEVDQAVLKLNDEKIKNAEGYIGQLFQNIEGQIANIPSILKFRSLQDLRSTIKENEKLIRRLSQFLDESTKKTNQQKLNLLLTSLKQKLLTDEQLDTLLRQKIGQLERLHKNGDIVNYDKKVKEIKKDIPLISKQMTRTNLGSDLKSKQIGLKPKTKQELNQHLKKIVQNINNIKNQKKVYKLNRLKENVPLLISYIDELVITLNNSNPNIQIDLKQVEIVKKQIQKKLNQNYTQASQNPTIIIEQPWWKRWFFFWI